MKKIWLGIGTLTSITPIAAVIACGSNANNEAVSSDKHQVSNKQQAVIPKLTKILYRNIVTEQDTIDFIELKGIDYFEKYNVHSNDIIDGDYSSNGGFLKYYFDPSQITTNKRFIIMNYHELFDYVHKHDPLEYPYLDN